MEETLKNFFKSVGLAMVAMGKQVFHLITPVLIAIDNIFVAVIRLPITLTSVNARGPPVFRMLFANEKGEMNIGGILMMGIGMVFLAVGFIMFPIATDAAADLLTYSYSANGTITDATFTGYTAVVGITPILILVGFLAAAIITGFLGFKVMKSGASAGFSPGNLMMLGLSIIFIAIGLIIEPVMLDGISSVVHGGGHGISSSFTGLSALILIAPMLVHIGFLAAAVFSGFFGIKSLAHASGSES